MPAKKNTQINIKIQKWIKKEEVNLNMQPGDTLAVKVNCRGQKFIMDTEIERVINIKSVGIFESDIGIGAIFLKK